VSLLGVDGQWFDLWVVVRVKIFLVFIDNSDAEVRRQKWYSWELVDRLVLVPVELQLRLMPR